jgi:hypothetical protein
MIPASAVETAAMEYTLEFGAPGIATPSLRHSNVPFVIEDETLNVTGKPSQIVCANGCDVMVGVKHGAVTVNVPIT